MQNRPMTALVAAILALAGVPGRHIPSRPAARGSPRGNVEFRPSGAGARAGENDRHRQGPFSTSLTKEAIWSTP